MTKRINLLSITRKYPPSVGGMENFCYQLFSGFEKNNKINQKVIALGKSQKHLIWFFPYCVIYLIFNAKKYDVIYFGDSLLCGPAFIGKIFARNTKFIVDVHGLDVVYPNPLYQVYLKLFYNCFQLYICNSSDTEKILHKRKINNTLVINRGVDEKKYVNTKKDKKELRANYNIEEDSIIILTVGRLIKRKGVEWFIKNVMPNFRNDNVYYFVVGEGPEKKNIRDAISYNHLDKKVFLLGRISDNELNALYVNSDIFVMPNISVENDKEGFGIVAIEASYAGLIVIASRIDGIIDAVIDNKNGHLLESENSQMYIEQIKDYIENKVKYYDNVDKFTRYTKEQYGLEGILNQYIEAFFRCLN